MSSFRDSQSDVSLNFLEIFWKPIRFTKTFKPCATPGVLCFIWIWITDTIIWITDTNLNMESFAFRSLTLLYCWLNYCSVKMKKKGKNQNQILCRMLGPVSQRRTNFVSMSDDCNSVQAAPTKRAKKYSACVQTTSALMSHQVTWKQQMKKCRRMRVPACYVWTAVLVAIGMCTCRTIPPESVPKSKPMAPCVGTHAMTPRDHLMR